MRRYDLDPAFALLRTLTPGESRTDTILRHRLGCNFWRRNWKAFLFTSLLLFFVAAAALLELSARWPASVIWTSQQLHVPWGGNPWKDLPFVQTRCFLVYFIGSGILFLTVFRAIVAWLWRKQLFDNIRQLLPRLAAGVLVGYLPLMTTSDLWKWLLRMPTIAAGLLALMMLVVSLGYLYVEARSAVIDGELPDIMRKELWIRVSRVFLVGLSETLLIGFVLSEFFGQTVVLSLRDDLENIPVIAVTGWVGYIFPKVVLFYAPFALFFGILVQLIWDEKTVAQPL
ncbi:MAG: hypothetical protein HY268_02375 [Deltaproteobacteria bacterium]|nr:hypothetical protein [Deltaproteobacteria bacterium]